MNILLILEVEKEATKKILVIYKNKNYCTIIKG